MTPCTFCREPAVTTTGLCATCTHTLHDERNTEWWAWLDDERGPA